MFASTTGTMTSSDFYYDFTGTGTYQLVPADTLPGPVSPSSSGYSTVTFGLLPPDTPTPVSSSAPSVWEQYK